MAPLAEVLVSVEEDYLDRMSEVASHLRAAGMRVDRAMELLGTITGTVDPSKIKRLHRIEGVAAVERSREVLKARPSS